MQTDADHRGSRGGLEVAVAAVLANVVLAASDGPALVLRVEGKNRHALRLDEVEEAILEVDQDLLDARG